MDVTQLSTDGCFLYVPNVFLSHTCHIQKTTGIFVIWPWMQGQRSKWMSRGYRPICAQCILKPYMRYSANYRHFCDLTLNWRSKVKMDVTVIDICFFSICPQCIPKQYVRYSANYGHFCDLTLNARSKVKMDVTQLSTYVHFLYVPNAFLSCTWFSKLQEFLWFDLELEVKGQNGCHSYRHMFLFYMSPMYS